jgi:Bacterial membrane protein YfhO
MGPITPHSPSPNSVNPRHVTIAIVALIAVWLILCRPWFFGNRVVPYDSKDQFYPALSFVSQSLRAGELPCWNPYIYGGYPMCSDPQSMIFSPLALGLMLLPNQPAMHWFDGIELFHLLLGAIGILLLAVRFRWTLVAGLFAALVFMFGGSAAARMQHVPIIFAYSYFPFALLTLDLALQTNRLRWAACFGFVAGIMAAHQVQVSYLFCLVLIGYVLYTIASAESIRDFLATRWRTLAMATSTGIAVLAVPIYLTLQFLPLSTRPGVSYETAVADSLHPLSFLTLLARNFFSNSNIYLYWGGGDITETYFYIGIIPSVLIAAYGIPSGILFERKFRYFLFVGVLAVLYAIGSFTPFYWLAYHIAPGVNLYRRPPDATFVMNAVLALASGFVMDRLLSGSQMRVKLPYLTAELSVLAALFAWGFHDASQLGKLTALFKGLWLPVLFVSIALALLYTIGASRSKQVRFRLGLVCLVLLCGDLGVYNAGSSLNATSAATMTLLSNGPVGKDPVANFLSRRLDLDHREGGPFRAEITGAGPAWADGPMMLGIQSTQGYNPIRVKLYQQVAGAQESGGVARPFTPLLSSYNGPLFNLLGIKYVVSAKSLAELSPHGALAEFGLAFDAEGLKVWENPSVLPRVITATDIFLEPDLPRAIVDGKVASVDYCTTVVLQHLPKTWGLVAQTQRGHGEITASLISYRNMQITLAVHAERDAIVVLNDLYYPYWRVYVDGHERELLQANYMFRGVHVKPGEQTVEFRFEPFSVPAIKGTFARLR